MIVFSILSSFIPDKMTEHKLQELGMATVNVIFNITIKDAISVFGPLVIAIILNSIGLTLTFKSIIILMCLIYFQSIFAMFKYLFHK